MTRPTTFSVNAQTPVARNGWSSRAPSTKTFARTRHGSWWQRAMRSPRSSPWSTAPRITSWSRRKAPRRTSRSTSTHPTAERFGARVRPSLVGFLPPLFTVRPGQRGAAVEEQPLVALSRPDADLVAVGIHREPTRRRSADHHEPRRGVAPVHHLVGAGRAAREAHGVAARERDLAAGRPHRERPFDDEQPFLFELVVVRRRASAGRHVVQKHRRVLRAHSRRDVDAAAVFDGEHGHLFPAAPIPPPHGATPGRRAPRET